MSNETKPCPWCGAKFDYAFNSSNLYDRWKCKSRVDHQSQPCRIRQLEEALDRLIESASSFTGQVRPGIPEPPLDNYFGQPTTWAEVKELNESVAQARDVLERTLEAGGK